MGSLLTEFIQILVGGISQVATGVGTGLSTLVSSVFVTGTGSDQALSAFAGVIALFAGISLALALCRYVVMIITSLGAKH